MHQESREAIAATQQWSVMLGRRRFLTSALALTAASGLGLSGCAAPEQATSPRIHALAKRLVPLLLPDRAGLTPASSVPVVDGVMQLVNRLEPAIVRDLESAALLLEWAGPILSGRWGRFSSLSDTDAVACLDAWQNGASLQRGVVTVFKKLVYASYWSSPATWAAVDFDGPVSDKWKIPALGNAPAPEVSA